MTDTADDNRCPHCNLMAHPVTQCARVAAVEYFPDGTIRRVEYIKYPPLQIEARDVHPPPVAWKTNLSFFDGADQD